MSDPFEVPGAYQRQVYGGSPMVSPRVAQQPTAQELKLKEIVSALNEVATARKNEAEAIQVQLLNLSADYEKVSAENDRLKAEQTITNPHPSTPSTSDELTHLRLENAELRARIAHLESLPPPQPTNHVSLASNATQKSLASYTSAPQTTPPPAPSKPLPYKPLITCAANILLLLIISLSMTGGSSDGVPKAVALAVKGGLTHTIDHEYATEDALLNATTTHFVEHVQGGPVALLGSLVELGYTVNPPKSWRVMAAVSQGLDAAFVDETRTAKAAGLLVANTCWECIEEVAAAPGSLWSIFVALLVAEIAAVAAFVFLKPSALKAPLDTTTPPEALPEILVPEGTAVRVHKAYVSPLEVNKRELTLQFAADTPLAPLVGADLHFVTLTLTYVDSVLDAIDFAGAHASSQNLSTRQPVGQNCTLPATACQLSPTGRPVLYVATLVPALLSEYNTNPSITHIPCSATYHRAKRADLDAASKGLL